MTNTVFYDIFDTETHVEYHCSRIREEVVNRRAMSKRTTLDNPNKDILVQNWHDEADLLSLVHVNENS